jgi:hypothetical protein
MQLGGTDARDFANISNQERLLLFALQDFGRICYKNAQPQIKTTANLGLISITPKNIVMMRLDPTENRTILLYK